MNQKHRLMCESWVEKRPEVSFVTAYGTASSKQSIKWKTRYAMLVVSSETRLSEIRFYQKKPRSCTEITDDIIQLQPWQYIVDIPSWIVDKGRPHVLRLRLSPESVVPAQHYRLQIAYQSSEEATAWMRCIQNQTKLTSGIQGHSFGVVAEECSATARIGVAGKHCLLFVSPTQVILAHKTDRSVVCVWPFETIRSYAADDDRRLVIEAGRCAPLGEGVYSFRTRENDDNVLFDLFDHYTTTATVEPPKAQGKGYQASAAHPEQTKSAPILSTAESSAKSRKAKKQGNRSRSDKIPLISQSTSCGTEEGDQPPQKPPLPENRKTVPVTPAKTNSVVPMNTGNSVSNTEQKKATTKVAETSNSKKRSKDDKSNDSMSKGLYDLDKLLYSLEGSEKPDQENVIAFECLGYDRPSCSVEKGSAEENAERHNVVHPYSINTIRSGTEMPQEQDSPQTNSGELNATQNNCKPMVAPKPTSAKRVSQDSSVTRQKEWLPDKPTPPYAKIDADKKKRA